MRSRGSRPTTGPRPWLLGAAVTLLAACGEPTASDGPWVVETAQRGDTTILTTVSGSTWQRSARLREEWRLGSIDGDEDTSFGEISHVAVAPEGSVFLFDPQVPQLYHIDSSGAFLGPVGREGEGPGEYSADVTGMAIVGDRLVLADADNVRLSAFSLDGVYQESLGAVSGLHSLFTPSVVPADGGGVAVQVLTIQPGPGVRLPEPWPIAWEIRDAAGAVQDTLRPQTLLGQPGRLEMGPAGDGVLVASRDDFLFELRRAGGAVVRVVMPYERAHYSEAEQRMMGLALAPAAAADGVDGADLPALKDPYLEFLYTPAGRVWARRPVADRPGDPSWRAPRYQPSVMDVFEGDGTYLGMVRLPENARAVAVTDSHVYVVELGAYDEPYLVRYRVEEPA